MTNHHKQFSIPAILMAVLLGQGATTLTAADEDTGYTRPIMVGDVNNDNKVNDSDCQQLAAYLLGEQTSLANPDAADVNQDEAINVADLIALRRKIAEEQSDLDIPIDDKDHDSFAAPIRR